jgi:hypothetical protein
MSLNVHERILRTVPLLASAFVPLGTTACSQPVGGAPFGPDEVHDAGPGMIVLGDAGRARDASGPDAARALDGGLDATHDGPDAPDADGPEAAQPETGVPEPEGGSDAGEMDTGVVGCDAGYEQCGSTCLVAVPDAVHGVFVAFGGPTADCGTMDIPCGTIGAALWEIQRSGAGTKDIVYVAESAQHYVEQVTLVPGVTIQGGWVFSAGQWSHPCALDNAQVTIEAPAGKDAVVLAGFSGSTALQTLTLRNDPSAATPGESLYGLLVSGSGTQVTLDNVSMVLGNGGSGANGREVPGARARTRV